MKTRRYWVTATGVAFCFCVALLCYAAYHHMGEIDSGYFLSVYPDKAGTKLDSCNLCHRGGAYQSGGKDVTVGSCQWCHYKYGYNEPHGNIDDTLNAYGADYKLHGRSADAVRIIDSRDSDGDGYLNYAEIAANRYPGDPNDDPSKVPAPSKVYTREELEAKPQHSQILLMNAHKSVDDYAQYTGVTFENLLDRIKLPSATRMTVYSPDGFSQTHPFQYDESPISYHVYGTYPAATFYYSQEADVLTNPTYGWCNYSSPSLAQAGLANGDSIINPEGLKLLLAIRRDGGYLTPGVLNPQNKLDGEGPYRVVPPQKIPGPPDQSSRSGYQDVIWPFDPNADHNAGYSTRSTTIVRVEPLPAGTTDIDLLEAGWNYIDNNSIVVYGAISPIENINDKLSQLNAAIDSIPASAFNVPSGKDVLKRKLLVISKDIQIKNYTGAYQKLQNDILAKLDGCAVSGGPDGNDWVKACDTQTRLYWAIYEIGVLLKIVV
ncbi:MAG: hypothetical protein A4E65_01893 [Syntrophorhabdus sp. PtaU1.Bin153]|nr:MAG: hypothetical protein A4E65_01893 [Syntrophorhabdus sp. PtaU1.Bin153]